MAKPAGRPNGIWEDTLAGLQAADDSDGVQVGHRGRIRDSSDVRDGLDVVCLSSGGGASSWGYKRAFALSCKQSTSSTSNAERFSSPRAQSAIGTTLGQVGYAEIVCRGPFEIIGGRFRNESDLGSTDVSIYKNGNATAVDSDTVDPGADTPVNLDLSASFVADDWFEVGLDPTASRVAFEEQTLILDCIETIVLE